MKTIFKRTSTHLLIATLAAGMGVHLSSHAQSATTDTSSVVITGQITANTCAVNVSDVGSPSSGNGSKSLFLGNIAGTAAAAGTTGPSLFGNPVTTMFTLGNATTPSTACTFNSGTNWDLALNLTTDKISTITSSLGTNTFLKNSIAAANGGTDAVVILSGGVNATPASATAANASNVLTLSSGGLMSGGTTGVVSTGALVLKAQWARSSTAAPTSGLYSQTIPLTVVYK